jgi:hypothetical protein
VGVDDLIKQARAFYADKRRVALHVEEKSVVVRAEGDRWVAAFLLTMAWSRTPPAAARDCGHPDDNMRLLPSSTIDRRVSVHAEMALDGAGRFVAYDEHGVVIPHLRVAKDAGSLIAFAAMPTTPARALVADDAGALVAPGTVVDDLGETFTCGTPGEIDTVRKVRTGGRDVWLLDHWAFDTGRSFVGADSLEPAP